MDTQPGGPRDQAKSGATLEYFTAVQVAELLQVSTRTVERWAAEDAAMPVLRVGRTVRFPRAALELWLQRRTQGSLKRRVSAA
jgi:excisionase family DNA binding protein